MFFEMIFNSLIAAESSFYGNFSCGEILNEMPAPQA